MGRLIDLNCLLSFVENVIMRGRFLDTGACIVFADHELPLDSSRRILNMRVKMEILVLVQS